MQEYGTAHQADYKKRGSKAGAYTEFIRTELLPFLQKKYRMAAEPGKNAFAGFSLSGLSAFDIAWNNSHLFSKVGVFSGFPSGGVAKIFFLKTRMPIALSTKWLLKAHIKKGSDSGFQTGTHDEQEDRNNNGIIDAIDDTLDLISTLKKLGYKEEKDIKYLEVDKGEHNPITWSKVMPAFIEWAYKR